MSSKRIAVALGSLTVAVLGASAARSGGTAADYVFSSPPVNALGVKGMADLRGKPVLIDFWGTH